MTKRVILAAAAVLVGAWIWGRSSTVNEGVERLEEAASIEELTVPTREIAAGHVVLRDPLERPRLDGRSAKSDEKDQVEVLVWADLADAKVPHVQNLIAKMSRRYPGRLLWAFRHLPQDQTCNSSLTVTANPGACRVAYAGLCAGEKFWSFFELLAKNPGRVDELSLRSLLGQLGIASDESARCMNSEGVRQRVETDGVQAGELGLAGGRWMVEGRPLPLGINAPGLDAAIRVALGEAQPDSDGRVPARRLAPVPASASVGTLPMRRVGDFYVDATEALVVRDGSARSVAGMVPTAANWFEADEACRTAGKRLCTVEEWRQACSGERFSDWLVEGRRWPYSDIWSPTLCWDSGNSTRTSAYETGQKPFCKSPEGVYDLTGNVWEWVGLTPGEAQLLGGSFLEGSNATCSAVLEGFGPRYSAPWTGFRCCAVQAVEATGAGLAPRSESSGGFPLPMEPDTSRVLVHVVQSGCPACAHSTRALAKLQEQGESTRVIAVGLGVDERELKRLLRPSGLQSKELPDPEGRWTGALRVVDLPTTLVLAETGQERARMEGFSQQGWRALVEALQVDEER